ncbi:methyl-accepting chemotaxis protein [Actinoplanes sp. NEAU-A12]|uniref:Methyl-accepting chemotaxis protein n=1 Tax=Actinoplanes sandaracinus TaxID=3045177 RepID=A0ABT6WW56_9ACTN|nr:methyl-accepting chemotaxis protein [Actinoplanes sandaracinus]MDI6103978.1 methyl-accepting chemotaxis protein [Actinoplanes sandaracinus]
MLAVAVVAVAGVMATGALSIAGIAELQNSRNAEIAEVLPYSTNLNAAALAAKAAANDERGFLLKGDTDFSEEALGRKKTVDAALAAARAVADPAEAGRMTAIQAATDKWFAALEAEFTLYQTRPDEATTLALGDNRDLRKAYETLLGEEVGYANAALLEGKEFDATVSQTRTAIIIAAITVLVVALVAAFYVARLLVQPLRRVGQVLDQVAEGDLSGDPQVHQRDEVGHMADSLRRATGTLRQTVTDLTAHAQTLGVEAQALAQTSRRSSSSADQGARQAATVADSAATMSHNIQTVAAGAEEMGASIREISESATQAVQVASRAVEVTSNTSAVMAKLGESSTEIGNVIKTITAIAEQTNLLAPNATIEAARAGDMGKGFAVVASEVKDLAQETARATEDIGTRVAAIQADTAGAVAAIEEISEIIGQINEFQTTIASAVEEQTVTTNEMSRNVSEAASAGTRVADTIKCRRLFRPGDHDRRGRGRPGRQPAGRHVRRPAPARRPVPALTAGLVAGPTCLRGDYGVEGRAPPGHVKIIDSTCAGRSAPLDARLRSDAMSTLPHWADPAVPDTDLDPQGLSRRGMLRRAGLFGAAFAATAALPAASPAAAATTAGSPPGDGPDLVYLVGDHHVHTQYSHDAKYTLAQAARRGAQYGLDWMVCTEHSNVGHDTTGAALEHADIVAARAENPRLLIFQGLEWYIPGAEHATVFTPPGRHEAEVLRQFERAFDGKLRGRTDGVAANEALAVAAIRWLATQKAAGYIDDALVLANHPSRLGIDSPHELRAWRDAAPDIMIGMEGAPGAQGAALPGLRGAGGIRGEYENKPSAQSHPGYPAEAYVTYGGFDWMTATVGGLWDAMLAEGKLFSITSNSDNHRTVYDTLRNGDYPAGAGFDTLGKVPDPVETGAAQPGSDFWPGQFSRTHVGVTRYGYREVMAGLRAGRVWVDHGQLVDGLDVRLTSSRGRSATLGGRLRVRRGERVTLTVTVQSASRPNFHGILPRLAQLDVIRGAVTGRPANLDSWRAPDTAVVKTMDVARGTGRYTVRVPLGAVTTAGYVRVRGSDGNRHGAGLLGARVDPRGPVAHTPGDGDPWRDTWLYTNPIFIDVS